MENVMELFMKQYKELEAKLYEVIAEKKEIEFQLQELKDSGDQLPYLREEMMGYRYEALLEVYRLQEAMKPYEGIMTVMKIIVE